MSYFASRARKKSLLSTINKLYHSPKHIANDLTVLRHAQSQYNVGSEKYIKQSHLTHLTWDEICQIPDFNLDINYNKTFIDSDLSERGVIQCFNLREELLANKNDIDLILCSPMLRALRTCRYVFEPFKIKKIVIPELTQVLRYSCDISNDIQEKIEEFTQFDWSLFPPNDNFWFLKTQTSKISQKIVKTLCEKQPLSFSEAQFQILMLLYEQSIFESDYDLRKRSRRVKQIINSYRAQYKNIIVISHHYLLQHLLARGYRQNHQPITSVVDEVPNATLIETSVDEILQVK